MRAGPDDVSRQRRDIGIDPDVWRSYLLATELHIPPGAADDMPAVLLDELLEVHRVVTEVRADAQR